MSGSLDPESEGRHQFSNADLPKRAVKIIQLGTTEFELAIEENLFNASGWRNTLLGKFEDEASAR
ncbi:MAG: hypothetical protein WD512_02355, partial [Candidatus Paceibacterota bacterium]